MPAPTSEQRDRLMLSGARSTMLYAIPYCIRKTAEKAAKGMPFGIPDRSGFPQSKGIT